MKKNYVIALAGIIIFLAVLIPLASTNPDGLGKVVELFGASEGNATWTGLMPNYTLSSVSNPYFSTLIAGIVGVVIVFILAFIIGKKLNPKQDKQDRLN